MRSESVSHGKLPTVDHQLVDVSQIRKFLDSKSLCSLSVCFVSFKTHFYMFNR